MREIPRRRLLQLGAGTAIAGLVKPHRVLAADAGRLVIGIDEDLSNLDPAWRNSPIDDSIIRCVCSNLVSFLPGDYDYQNDAAESIDTGLTQTIGFVLKQGLSFGDGFGEVTAEDVKFSYERFIKPGADGLKPPYAPTWSVLKSVEITGKYRGRINLSAPSLSFWKNGLAEVSGAILSRKAFEQLGAKTRTQLVGSGPYRLKEWVPGEHILLAANPDWHGGPQAFAEILLQPTRDPDLAIDQITKKQIHFAKILTKDENAVRKVADSRMIAIPSSNHVGLGMNMARTPLDDARVRKAIRLMIDPEQVVAAGYAGAADAARSIIAPLSTGYWADAPEPTRDVEAAKQLLAEAGRRNPHLRLAVTDLPHRRRDRAEPAARRRRPGHRRCPGAGRLLGQRPRRRRQEAGAIHHPLQRQVRSRLHHAMVPARADRQPQLAPLVEPGL